MARGFSRHLRKAAISLVLAVVSIGLVQLINWAGRQTAPARTDYATQLNPQTSVQGAQTTKSQSGTAGTAPSAAPGSSLTSGITDIPPAEYKVSGFVDGDTIRVEVNGKTEKLRLIGVDTPETHAPGKPVQCYGREAAAFTKQLIGSSTVRLATDPKSSDRDRYGRLLRYVYLPDGRLVQQELLSQGYAFAYLSFPFTKMKDFEALQASAQAAHRGLWAACHPVRNEYGNYTSNAAG